MTTARLSQVSTGDTVADLKSQLRAQEDELIQMRNEAIERAHLEKKLTVLQAVREKERSRFMEEIYELRSRLSHEQVNKKFLIQSKISDSTKRPSQAEGDLSQTINSLTKENQKLLRELEYQGDNADLLIRENNRLSKVVSSLQVECSLQKTAIEELSRKCKVKDKVIELLRKDEKESKDRADYSTLSVTRTDGAGGATEFGVSSFSGGTSRSPSRTPMSRHIDLSPMQTPQFIPDTDNVIERGGVLTMSQLVSSPNVLKTPAIKEESDEAKASSSSQPSSDATDESHLTDYLDDSSSSNYVQKEKMKEKKRLLLKEIEEVWEKMLEIDLNDIREALHKIGQTIKVSELKAEGESPETLFTSAVDRINEKAKDFDQLSSQVYRVIELLNEEVELEGKKEEERRKMTNEIVDLDRKDKSRKLDSLETPVKSQTNLSTSKSQTSSSSSNQKLSSGKAQPSFAAYSPS
ncbi:uncharacterized protein MONOS_7449 [Monocercomonoides exilis]|uniref:uncharacterized protein n=1 Tax=Monocercomonoides exilis TaxID=2049356 RepID=UPI003559E846|nr:hypothetical protein MONOS_7449 [Monocercomonoides exilis]|eukprot:MONOS_7449.1-p1 / transcript=MONOS_7449.1 / gene=MONOS_7449 / organism=Monocercomonoides_exilis_PA203 / gene_product=unspecified product / transcript_product=unspecified product / location=Mono_scaffold00255:885-2942(+) / protein_length=465 / sequence_SO=supercontig / SO=protein_coding / is_pseudo=false